MEKKISLKIIFISFVLIIIVLSIYYTKNQANRFYCHFDNTDINGKLEYVKIGYHGVVFKIEGVKDKFIFYPYTSDLNNHKIFNHLAFKGDIVIKPIHADTLILKKENKIYLYTFRKFER